MDFTSCIKVKRSCHLIFLEMLQVLFYFTVTTSSSKHSYLEPADRRNIAMLPKSAEYRGKCHHFQKSLLLFDVVDWGK